MDSLPIPAASLVSVNEGNSTKRHKRGEGLPCSFFAITEDDGNPKIVGLFHVSSVRRYSDSKDTTPQVLNLIATGASVNTDQYVVWNIDSYLPLSEAFNLSEGTSVAGDIRFLKVLKGLTAAGYEQLLLKRVEVGGTRMALEKIVHPTRQVNCFKMSSKSWHSIRTAGLKSLVTTSNYLYHAGVPDSDVQAASQDSESQSSTLRSQSFYSQSSARGSSQVDGNSDDSGGEQEADNDTSRHSFDTILSCMRLSILLRNACNLKEAIKASLAAYNSASKARSR